MRSDHAAGSGRSALQRRDSVRRRSSARLYVQMTTSIFMDAVLARSTRRLGRPGLTCGGRLSADPRCAGAPLLSVGTLWVRRGSDDLPDRLEQPPQPGTDSGFAAKTTP